jgi:hypothetical protein
VREALPKNLIRRHLQVVKTSTLVWRHRSSLICCMTTEQTTGREAEAQRYENEKTSRLFCFMRPPAEEPPFYRGAQQLDEFDLLNTRNRPLKPLYVQSSEYLARNVRTHYSVDVTV